MNYQEKFSEYTRHHFAYLNKKFGCSLVEDQYHETSASYVVAFQNKWRFINLVWGLKDQRFYFGVFRLLSNGQPAPYADNSSDHFYIPSLAGYFNNDFDIKHMYDVTPNQTQPSILEEKIRLNAESLHKYGKDILLGKSWFDWRRKEIVKDDTTLN